jgi:hypothetical protein
MSSSSLPKEEPLPAQALKCCPGWDRRTRREAEGTPKYRKVKFGPRWKDIVTCLGLKGIWDC